MWLFEQEGRLLLVVPVPPEPSCTECHLPTPCAPEGLGVKKGVSKDPQHISGTCDEEKGKCCPLAMDLQHTGPTQAGHSGKSGTPSLALPEH